MECTVVPSKFSVQAQGTHQQFTLGVIIPVQQRDCVAPQGGATTDILDKPTVRPRVSKAVEGVYTLYSNELSSFGFLFGNPREQDMWDKYSH